MPRGPSFRVIGGALTTYALASRLTFGARLGLEARRPPWSIGLEGWTSLPATWEVEEGGRIQASLWAGALVPCFEVVTRLRLCALASVGSLRAESVGVASTRSEHVPHVMAGGRGSFSWPLSQALEFVASVDVAAALNRPRFQLDGSEVWRPSAALAVLGIGASAHFF